MYIFSLDMFRKRKKYACACVLYVSRNLNAHEQDILSKILTKAILLIDHDLDTIFLVGSFVCSLKSPVNKKR